MLMLAKVNVDQILALLTLACSYHDKNLINTVKHGRPGEIPVLYVGWTALLTNKQIYLINVL